MTQLYVPLIDYPSGQPLVPPLAEEAVGARLIAAFGRNADRLRRAERSGVATLTFRGEATRAIEDRGDPRVAGWTLVMRRDDPRRQELLRALRPLAEHRGMADPEKPLLLGDEEANDWNYWLESTFSPLAGTRRPFYFLLVGGPERLSFKFQSFLDMAAAVGRLDFDSVDDYAAYAAKVVRLETAAAPATKREALFFATDLGPRDPTYYSKRYMVDPLAAHARGKQGLEVRMLAGSQATKHALLSSLASARPAVIYSASHGFAAANQPEDVRRRINGSIVCQRTGSERNVDEYAFGAGDVPDREPFLEGAIFFEFACYGYGTPAESEFAHWLPELDRRNSESDFVAALPKRLLAHPRGPVGFVGHLDVALLNGFTDEEAPDIKEAWHPRLDPFASALDSLLRLQPVGLAMERMNFRFGDLSVRLSDDYDRLSRRKVTDTPEFRTRLARTFVQRGDAQNYMILGDPAVRVRLPAGRNG